MNSFANNRKHLLGQNKKLLVPVTMGRSQAVKEKGDFVSNRALSFSLSLSHHVSFILSYTQSSFRK